MNSVQLEVYEALGRPIVGGSYAIMAQNPNEGKSFKDLDLCIPIDSFRLSCEVMESLGARVHLDNPNSKGFDLRRQYYYKGEKIDLFLINKHLPKYHIIDGVRVADMSMVWAARGYYAAKGGKKYTGYMVESGFWPTERVVKKQFILLKKALWFLRGLFS